MTAPTLPIETDRLLLRAFEPGDLEAVMAYHALPEVQRYMDIKVHDAGDAKAALNAMRQQKSLTRPGDSCFLAVERREDGTVLGQVSLRWADATAQQAELRFVFNPVYAKRGYAKEAVKAALTLGFDEFRFHRIFARCDARVVSFRHLPTLGIIAIASVSQAATIGALWTAVYTVLLLMLPIAAALIAGSIWTSRLLNESYRTRNALESALAQNQVLFREIHHRVKNNLQSVSSLLQLQPIAPEIKVEMGRRIAAMSAVHEHIYRSDKFSVVAVKDYLQTLITNLRESYNSDADIDIRLEDLLIDKDGAMPLGLIVNEVVSNTFKHAFVDGRQGVITVTLERTDGNLGRLVIADNGVGFDPTQRAKGMGRRLIVGLTEQLQGESSFVSESGSRFTLTFPLARAEQVS